MLSASSPSVSAYQKLLATGELEERAAQAWASLADCTLCPWECHVNRLDGKMGVCKAGSLARVASYGPHHGEEKVLSGTAGSGTVFFSRCNQHCIFCQNAEISQADAGEALDADQLAGVFLNLQSRGCHNINLVTPTHLVAQILAALLLAVRAGLHIPLVYNTGGYDKLETLRLLDGLVDIYLPDMKFNDVQTAKQLTGCKNYPAINRAAVQEMYRQVGNLRVDEAGIAQHGLIIRHLVMPNSLAGTRGIMQYISSEISPDAYVNIMDQYHPAYRSAAVAALNRPIESTELQKACAEARAVNLLHILS
jgi:putative pyruvate formate lyase activating enzyme